MLQRFLDPATLASIAGLDLVAKTVVDGFVAGLPQPENNPCAAQRMIGGVIQRVRFKLPRGAKSEAGSFDALAKLREIGNADLDFGFDAAGSHRVCDFDFRIRRRVARGERRRETPRAARGGAQSDDHDGALGSRW